MTLWNDKSEMRTVLSTTIFILFYVSNSFGQRLSLQQVSDILGDISTEDVKKQLQDYDGEIDIKYNIDDSSIIIEYCWNGNPDITFEPDVTDICNSLSISLDQIADLQKTTNPGGKYIIQLHCNSGKKDCVHFERKDIINYYHGFIHDDPESHNHYDFVNLFYFSKYETQELVFRGLKYLAYEINEERQQRRNSVKNFDFSEGASVVMVDLVANAGVSEVPVSIGTIQVMAILDSGASDVSLPESLEERLIQMGELTDRDYLPPGFYTVADGRTVLSRRFIIPEIELQGVKVTNVRCSVNESENVILLGRAFLDAFKSWSIDNESNQLILKY